MRRTSSTDGRSSRRRPADAAREPRAGLSIRWGPLAALAGLILAGALLAGAVRVSSDATVRDDSLIWVDVKRRDLPLSLIERGTLESQRNTTIRCEVGDVMGDGIYGTIVLWMAENGSIVNQGDLIVELDASSHRDRVDEQMLRVIYARGQFIARSLDYENRKTSNENKKANAELAVKLARLRLEQFEDEDGGIYQITMQGVELALHEAMARRALEDQNLTSTEQLHRLGYKSRGDVAAARLQALRARNEYARQLARRRVMLSYGYRRAKLILETQLESAERYLKQVERDNEAWLAQNRVWLKMAEMGKYWNELKLAKYQEQLEHCKIYAPHSGMVIHHVATDGWGRSHKVSVGDAVRYRQPIMLMPDLRHMRAKVAVHEAAVHQVRPGLPASVWLEAFPEQVYPGRVASVSVLARPGGVAGSGVRMYDTIVTLDGEVEGLRPGMTAIVEIQFGSLNGALCVPVASLVREGEHMWCYVRRHGRPEKQLVAIGETTPDYAEVRSGLRAGQQVAINPHALAAPPRRGGVSRSETFGLGERGAKPAGPKDN